MIKLVLLQIEQIREREAHARKEVIGLGIKVRKLEAISQYFNFYLQVSERLNLASSGGKDQEDDEYECQVCNANLFVSLVRIYMMIMMIMMMAIMSTSFKSLSPW